MAKISKYQCPVTSCEFQIPKTISHSLFKRNTPLCQKFYETLTPLPIDFPEITKEQKQVFDDFFVDYSYPKYSKNGLVIVETREDYRLEFVLKNIAYYVPNWTLHIFHSAKNKVFIETILKDKVANVHLHLLEQDITSNQDYNKVIKDLNFWQKLSIHDKVLIFQTDTFMLRSGIEAFLDFDYIGAVWPWWKKKQSIKRVGGNGGFSLRKVSTMIHILKKYGNREKAPIRNYQNEDIFFSYHLYKDKKAILPNWHEAMHFSSENCLCPNTMAVHQAWKFQENYKPEFQLIKRESPDSNNRISR